MPHSQSFILKAQGYVAASNAHDISTIGPMLAADCRYVSSGVGDHSGKGAILSMMDAFFANNPDVHWQAEGYRLEAPNRVVFDFAISLSGKTTQGVERITFNAGGEITSIEVTR